MLRLVTSHSQTMLRLVTLSLLLLPSQTRLTVQDYLGVSKPFFSPDTSAVVEVREGATAYITCQETK